MSEITKAALITHPVRAQILSALMGRQLTANQIAALLPHIPIPSLYRHLKTLMDGGALRIAEETRINGALTKIYASAPGMTKITAEDVQDATKAEHLQHFTTLLNTIAEQFRTSLESDAFDPLHDPLHGYIHPLHLSRDEAKEFMDKLHEFLRPYYDVPPSPERLRLLFATIVFPDQKEPPRESVSGKQ